MKKFTILSAAFIVMLSWQLNAQITLDLKVFLEGPYVNPEMSTVLNSTGQLPTSQPYLSNPGIISEVSL